MDRGIDDAVERATVGFGSRNDERPNVWALGLQRRLDDVGVVVEVRHRASGATYLVEVRRVPTSGRRR